MIDFSRSFLTWTHHPFTPDPIYKFPGGLLADQGDVVSVRLKADARLEVRPDHGMPFTCYVIAPCRTEYTIVTENLFQIPSGEFRGVYSDSIRIPIAKRPSFEKEHVRRSPISEGFAGFTIDIHHFQTSDPVLTAPDVITATKDAALMNATCVYRKEDLGLTITVEFPIELINYDESNETFQVCTEPLILPDLTTWDGTGLDRVFLAAVAFSTFDQAEFILRREINADETELPWYHEVRGRDRHEVHKGATASTQHRLQRPLPLVFNEVWTQKTDITITRASGAS